MLPKFHKVKEYLALLHESNNIYPLLASSSLFITHHK